jgi:hypothetical protein
MTTITIDLNRKCAECGKGGAVDNGLCLSCTGNALNPKRRMKSWQGQAVQRRFAMSLAQSKAARMRGGKK